MANNDDLGKEAIKRQKTVKSQFKVIKDAFSQKPILIAGIIGLVLLLGVMFSGGKEVSSHELAAKPVLFEAEEDEMVGIKESVDPRDVWTARVEETIKGTSLEFKKEIEEQDKKKTNSILKMQEELVELKANLQAQKEKLDRRELEDSLMRSNTPVAAEFIPVRKRSKSLGLFSAEYGVKKKNTKNYVTSGTFARAVLLTGVVVGTGTNSQSNPEPIMMRLTDAGIFSKGGRTDQIKEAILIGDCSGDLSAERARCRLQTLSLENEKGEIVERNVQGWIVGEDGRNGVKGMVIDKSSDMLRMAMLNGVLGGMSSFLQNQSTKGAFPISPLTGQQNSLSGVSQIKGGMASGAGDAFSKMADFIMERFNSMSPQIVVASGREVDVVFRVGVDLVGEFDQEEIGNKRLTGNLNQSNYYSNIDKQNKPQDQANAFGEVIQQINNGASPNAQRGGF